MIWQQPAIQQQTQLLLDSFETLLGYALCDRAGGIEAQAERLFCSPFVVVSHGCGVDPIFNYGNQTALDLWVTDFKNLTQMPSRYSAEPMHREERQRLLERTKTQGYIDDYQGIRITTTGKRFRIQRAIIWNVFSADHQPYGQAATFAEWEWV